MNRLQQTLAALVPVVTIATLGIALVAGQQPPASVYTAEQATAGRAAYQASCASCHMPDLAGAQRSAGARRRELHEQLAQPHHARSVRVHPEHDAARWVEPHGGSVPHHRRIHPRVERGVRRRAAAHADDGRGDREHRIGCGASRRRHCAWRETALGCRRTTRRRARTRCAGRRRSGAWRWTRRGGRRSARRHRGRAR